MNKDLMIPSLCLGRSTEVVVEALAVDRVRVENGFGIEFVPCNLFCSE